MISAVLILFVSDNKLRMKFCNTQGPICSLSVVITIVNNA